MKRLFSIFIFLLISGMSYSQAWMQYLPQSKDKDDLTFFDYQEAFNAWCLENAIDHDGYFVNKYGVRQKAYGWKQFKRWEISMEGWYDYETGAFVRKNILAEYERFKREYMSSAESLDGNWISVAYSNEGSGQDGNGRINCVAFHPSNPDIFWVGTALGGIWATTDHGQSWTPKSDYIGSTGIGAIAVPSDYNSSQTIYLGTGDRGTWRDRGVGILKSTDGGNSWNTTGLSTVDPSDLYVGRILIHPGNNSLIYAATSDGVYKSLDAGSTWVLLHICKAIDMEFKPGDPNIIYVSTRWASDTTRVFRTTDGGSTWVNELKIRGCRTELAVSADEPDWVYALVAAPDEGLQGVYRSTNSGEDFNLMLDGSIQGNNILAGDCNGDEDKGQGEYDLAFAVSPLNANLVFAGGVNTWKSEDGGLNWNVLTNGYHNCPGSSTNVHVDIHYIEWQYESDTVFLTSDGGIYFSTNNGSTWDNISGGLMINQPYRIANSAAAFGEILMGQQDNGVVLWENNAPNFVGGGDGTDVIINPVDVNNQYFTNNSRIITATSDHWASRYYFSTPTDSNDSWFKPIVLLPPDTIFYGGHDLWKSTDRGITLTKIWDLPTDTLIRRINPAPSDSKIIYLLTQDKLYKTTDGGGVWTDITANLPFNHQKIYRIEVKQEDPNTLWIAQTSWDDGFTVIKSTDGGSTWTSYGQGLPDVPWYEIIQNDLVTDYDELYVCGFFGVFMKMGDNNWVPFNNGLPNLVSFDMEMCYDGPFSKLRIGTHGRGVWESELFSVSSTSSGTWLGIVDENWHNPLNWSLNQVPDGGADVVILPNVPNFPRISAGNANAHNVSIYNGAQLTVEGRTLTVSGNLSVFGTIQLSGTNPILAINGSISWESTASIGVTGSGSTIEVTGDWYFKQGANVSLSGTETRFTGSLTSQIYCHSSSAYFGDITVNKPYPFNLYFNDQSISNMVIMGNLTVASTTKLLQHANRNLKVSGNIDIQGDLYQYEGTFICASPGIVHLAHSSSYFNTLIIDHGDFSGISLLTSDIQVRDSLYLKKGALWFNQYNVSLHGNLVGSINGTIGATTGQLKLKMEDEQKIYGTLFIPNVELNKTADTLRVMTGASVGIGSYDWTAGSVVLETGSTMTIDNLVDGGIFGVYRAKGGAVLSITNPDGPVNLNAKLFITGGTVNVSGGTTASYWPDAANAELHMSGGILDFKDRGIYVRAHPTYTFTDNVTGGTIRTSGGFQGDHTGFNPTGGTIEIYGMNNGDLGHGPGSNFYKLIVNKDASAPQLNVMSNLDINSDLVITAGDLDINGYTVDVAGLLDITGRLTMINAASTLNVGSSVTWRSGSSSYILDGLITFGTHWSFLDGTSAMLAGNNTVKLLGNSASLIVHKDADARFKHLLVQKTASFLVTLDEASDYPLRVDGNLTVKSPNNLRVLSADVKVAGTLLAESGANLTLSSGGSIDATNLTLKNTVNLVNGSILTGDLCTVEGNLNLTDGGTVVFDDLNLYGTLDINAGSFLLHNSYYQSAASHLILDGGIFKLDKPYSGALYGFGGITDLNGGIFEISHEGAYFGAATVVNFNGGDMRIGGGFQATFANTFQPDTGSVEFINAVGSAINCSNGNYFNKVIINKNPGSSACTLVDDLTIQDDLVLQSGELQTQNNTLDIHGDLFIEPAGMLTAGSSGIYVSGNWNNNRGTTGFVEGTSSVWLESATPLTLITETFYNLDLAKSLSPGQYVQLQPGATLDVTNNLTLGDGGALLMNDNTMLTVNGTLHIKNGGGLNANPSAPNTVINCGGHWWDYNTTTSDDLGFTPGFSTVNFTGAGSQELIVYQPGITFFNLNIQKSANGITPFDDITVLNYFSLNSGTWQQAATDLNFNFKGDFTISDASNWQDPVNTIMFTGTSQQNLTNAAGNWLYFGPVLVERQAMSESGALNINTHLSCSDQFRVVSGEAIFDENSLHCVGSLIILPSGQLSLLNGSNLFMGDNAEVYVNGGTLNIWAAANNRSSVTHMGSGHFSFLVENGGVIDAAYTDFEYMGQRGLNLDGTGLIGGTNPLNYCAFRHGDAGSTLMTINTAQEVTLYNVDFPANTWSGTYNISKSAASGNVIMHNASGPFGGPFYENDPFSLVQWPSMGVWEGDYSTEWHDRANWRFDYQVPDVGTDVVIPSGKPNYPVLSSQADTVKTLKMEANTSLSILQNNLKVNEWADIRGQVIMADDPQEQIDFFVDSLVWQPGSSVSAMGKSTFWITGDMFIRQGTNLNMTAGEFRYTGTEESRLICHDTATIFSLYNAKTPPASLSLEGDTLAQLTINGNFQLGTNAILKCPSTQEWVLDGGVRNTSNGHFRCENGTIRLSGTINPNYFRVKQGDYFNNLVIDTLVNLYTTTGYSDTLRVMGDLVLAAGSGGSTTGLTANAFKILVWGDWINNLYTTAFTAGTSKVIFMDPSVPQNVDGYSIFYDLSAGSYDNSVVNFYDLNYVNNVMESYFTTNVYGSLYTNIVYSDNDPAALNIHDGGYMEILTFHQGAPVTVTLGMFEARDLAQDYITGNYTVANGLISLGQTNGSNDSHDLYFANLTINEGYIWFIGGNGQSMWPRTLGSASVTMTNGTLDLMNHEVFITDGNFTENITGGKIRTFWGFSAAPTCTTFHPAGGTVELYGTEDCSFSMPEPACWFYNLHLSKTEGGGAYPSSNMRVKNEFRMNSGYMETDGFLITVGP